MLLQAHRGVSSEYPENTMAAFRAAFEQGFPIIELDPNVTSDNKIVVLHDDTVNRTAHLSGEPVKISEITYEQSQNYDVGNGEKIPLLSDVLRFAREKNIRIKLDNMIQRFTKPQLDELFRVLKESGADFGFTSNSVDFIRVCTKAFPGCTVHYDGAVSDEIIAELKQIVCGKLCIWLPLKNSLTDWFTGDFATPDAYKKIKQNALLGIWIVNEPSDFEKAKELGADIVETTGTIKP